MNKSLYLILVLAFTLRIWNTWERPYWTDEVTFCRIVQEGMHQEFIPQAAANITGLECEYLTRLPFVICGTLTVWFAFLVLPAWSRLWAAAFIAVCPLFVIFDSIARPYAYAGMFLVLAWRNPWFMLGALASTPIALVGLPKKLFKNKWLILAIVASAVTFFLIRPDAERDFWKLDQIMFRKAWWYLPLLTLVMWIATSEKLKDLLQSGYLFMAAVYGVCLYFSLSYSQIEKGVIPYTELAFSDFRKIPHVDYSTNAQVHNWYAKPEDIKFLRHQNLEEYIARLERGDTLLISADYYALYPISHGFFNPEWHWARDYWLRQGHVFVDTIYMRR